MLILLIKEQQEAIDAKVSLSVSVFDAKLQALGLRMGPWTNHVVRDRHGCSPKKSRMTEKVIRDKCGAFLSPLSQLTVFYLLITFISVRLSLDLNSEGDMPYFA